MSGVVASFAIGDMLIHNRRKRNEWLAEQQRNSAVLLEEARAAVVSGLANEDQILLLNRERAAQEAEAARKAKKGIFTRVKESLVGGLSEEEVKGGKIGAAARATKEAVQEKWPEQKQDLGILKAIDEHRRQGEQVEAIIHPSGGPLDREAAASADALVRTSKSWTSWMTGR